MNSIFNDIVQIKLAESTFNPDLMRNLGTWYAELNEESIVTYYVEYGSRKKLNKNKVSVKYQEMNSFFKEVYKLVRNVDELGQPVDDTAHTITLYYAGCHKEIIEGDASQDGKSLLSSIYKLMEKYGSNYWFSEQRE